MLYKINVAGSRSLEDKLERLAEEYLELFDGLLLKFPIGEKKPSFISGGARGPDHFSEKYAFSRGYPCDIFLADWGNVEGVKNVKYRKGVPYNPSAGILRNVEMGDAEDALILMWDGKSNGSRHMLEYTLKLKKPVILLTIDIEGSELYKTISYENLEG